MAGVEILHSSEVLVSGRFDGGIFLAMVFTWLILGFIIGIIMSIVCLDEAWLIGGLYLGAIVGIILGGLTSAIRSTPEVYETHYKVLISDEVSMNEFLEEYEIIDQEGKIYTVKEKED